MVDRLLLEARNLEAQLQELGDAGFDLALAAEPVRCGVCNATLDRVEPTEPTPEYTPEPVDTDVWRCPACGQYFWQGSHWDDVAETLAGID